MNKENSSQLEENSIIEKNQYEAMKNMLGDDFLTLISDFFKDCTRYSNKLETLTATSDTEGLLELFHELKGAAALLGLAGISQWATTCETACANGHPPTPDQIKGKLTTLENTTRAHLKKHYQ